MFRTYFHQETGAYLGSHAGPKGSSPWEGHPSVPGDHYHGGQRMDIITKQIVDLPPPPEPTAAEKLEAKSGVTVGELKQILGLQ